MDKFGEEQIIESWAKNASPWAKAVANNEIESRRLVTDNAVSETVRTIAGKDVLDIGCGEGWLARELNSLGRAVTGIDAIPALIDVAKAHGGGDFRVLSYEQLAPQAFEKKFDIAVCNFSLLGKESVERVVNTVPALLKTGGYFIVQTLHPHSSCGDLPYVDGWRRGSWEGFSSEFCDPAPWYFRTLDTWVSLLVDNGLRMLALKEPLDAKLNRPASLLLVAGA